MYANVILSGRWCAKSRSLEWIIVSVPLNLPPQFLKTYVYYVIWQKITFCNYLQNPSNVKPFSYIHLNFKPAKYDKTIFIIVLRHSSILIKCLVRDHWTFESEILSHSCFILNFICSTVWDIHCHILGFIMCYKCSMVRQVWAADQLYILLFSLKSQCCKVCRIGLGIALL